MNHKRIFGMLGLILVLIGTLGVPQAIAADHTHPGRSVPPQIPLQTASSPLGSCTQLGLSDNHGYVLLTGAKSLQLFVKLQHAQPASSYNVWIGYKNSADGTSCDGSWQQVGPIYVEEYGSATFGRTMWSSGSRQYIIELRDPTTGTVLYATPFISTGS